MVPLALRALGGQLRQQQALSALGAVSVSVKALGSTASFGTDAVTRKSVLHLLNNRDDPEVDAAVKQYLKSLYKGGAATSVDADEGLELSSKIEKKYVAAQVVEHGIQSISLPLAWESTGSDVPVKRYVAQMLAVAKKAGFEDPMKEVEKRLKENHAVSETVKEFLGRVKSCVSPDYHAALVEAVQSVEAETGSAVVFDASSEGYKKFVGKVQALAQQNNIPVGLLHTSAQRPATEEAASKLQLDFQRWLQSAYVQDAAAELEAVKAQATTALDSHLSKTADQIREEGKAAMQQLLKKLDNAKGAKWAEQFKKDIKFTEWFDATVQANPAKGPSATA